MEGRDYAILEALFALNEPLLRRLLCGIDVRNDLIRLYSVRIFYALDGMHINAVDIDQTHYVTATFCSYLHSWGLGLKLLHKQYKLVLKVLALTPAEATVVLNKLAANTPQWGWTGGTERATVDCACALIRNGACYTGSAVEAIDLLPAVRALFVGLVADRNAAKVRIRVLYGIARFRCWQVGLPRELIWMIASAITL